MRQDELLLITTALSGLLSLRWTLRLAPWGSELPVKTLAATLLAGLVGGSFWFGFSPSGLLSAVAVALCPLYVFAPLALVALGRARAHGAAARLTDLLYWTPAGRGGVKRLLAQSALHQGDAASARALLPEADPLLLAQAYALEQDWDALLALGVPERGELAFLAQDARVQAHVARGELVEAEAELARMRERWHREQGPIGFRSLALAEARIAAERGQQGLVRERLGNAPPGIPAHVILGLVARSAEQAQAHTEAAAFYAQAYARAPAGQRGPYRDKLEGYGEPLPRLARPARPVGVFALLVSLALAYLAQLWLDAGFGPYSSSAGAVRASSVVAAFMMNLRGLPEAEASWRHLSYAFVHGNLLHIAFNAWVLFDIGRLYEARRSWSNLLSAFVLGTLMGAYLSVLVGPSGPLLLVGASGGILGVAGALLADAWRSDAPQDRMLTRSLLQWMVILMLFSLAIPNVSLWGHAGGLVGGLLWGFVRQGLPASRRLDLFAGGLALGLLLYALAQSARVFFTYVA